MNKDGKGIWRGVDTRAGGGCARGRRKGGRQIGKERER